MDFRIIDQFRPSQLDTHTIERELREFLQSRGMIGTCVHPTGIVIGVRRPEECYAIATTTDYKITDWHRDGLTNEWDPNPDIRNILGHPLPLEEYALMWSNVDPTEVRLLPAHGGRQFWAQPWDVMLFNNRRCQHRSPVPTEDRWFVRIMDPIFREEAEQ